MQWDLGEKENSSNKKQETVCAFGWTITKKIEELFLTAPQFTFGPCSISHNFSKNGWPLTIFSQNF